MKSLYEDLIKAHQQQCKLLEQCCVACQQDKQQEARAEHMHKTKAQNEHIYILPDRQVTA